MRKGARGGFRSCGVTDRPLEVCTRSVIRVEVAGQTQFRANMAYLNSSSHTTWSGKDGEKGHMWCTEKVSDWNNYLKLSEKAHLQIWHGTYFPVWVSEHKGGSLGQSPSLPRLSGSSDGPNGDSCSLISLPLKGKNDLSYCLTAAMRSTSLRLLKMKQASALSILQDRPFRIRENTSKKPKYT